MNDKMYIEYRSGRIDLSNDGHIQMSNGKEYVSVRMSKEQMRKMAEFLMKALNK